MEVNEKKIKEAFISIIQVLIDDGMLDDAEEDLIIIGNKLGFTQSQVINMFGTQESLEDEEE